MNAFEIVVIVALTGYAVYQQTKRHELNPRTRFRLAIIYGVVGLVVGGFHLPRTTLSIVFLIFSILLSLGLGLLRGRLTRIWRVDDITYSQGTRLTVSLFLLLIVLKVILGAIAYVSNASDDGGFGEIMIMIAIMVAVQAELISRRARRLQPIGSAHV